ncbi:hypothetical protein [Methanoculleus chikugoensis]|uniref:hypothetical protein n=1 Tax=Methanoculleus chikugoensis TaxID=118126 RepID=UPI0006D10A92|nr:hypothetical protein [Methanoculleus chikugoensis]
MRETDILGGTDIRVLPPLRQGVAFRPQTGDDNRHQRSGDRRRIPIPRRFGSGGRMQARVHGSVAIFE